MLRALTPDGSFLFITRIARMFGYGFLSLVLVLYLEQVGLNQVQIYRLRRPELLSWVPLIPLQKLPVRFSPEGLRKYPISRGFFS